MHKNKWYQDPCSEKSTILAMWSPKEIIYVAKANGVEKVKVQTKGTMIHHSFVFMYSLKVTFWFLKHSDLKNSVLKQFPTKSDFIGCNEVGISRPELNLELTQGLVEIKDFANHHWLKNQYYFVEIRFLSIKLLMPKNEAQTSNYFPKMSLRHFLKLLKFSAIWASTSYKKHSC